MSAVCELSDSDFWINVCVHAESSGRYWKIWNGIGRKKPDNETHLIQDPGIAYLYSFKRGENINCQARVDIGIRNVETKSFIIQFLSDLFRIWHLFIHVHCPHLFAIIGGKTWFWAANIYENISLVCRDLRNFGTCAKKICIFHSILVIFESF